MRNSLVVLSIAASTAAVYAFDCVKNEREAIVAEAATYSPAVDFVLVGRLDAYGVMAEVVEVVRMDLPGEPVASLRAVTAPAKAIVAHSSGGLPG